MVHKCGNQSSDIQWRDTVPECTQPLEERTITELEESMLLVKGRLTLCRQEATDPCQNHVTLEKSARTFAWIVTTNDPREIITTTLVNTAKD